MSGLRGVGHDVTGALFLCGPLAWAPVLEIVAGQAGALDAQAAELPGYALKTDDRTCFPALVAREGHSTAGLLVRDVSPEVLARLRFLAGGLGAEEMRAETAEGAGAICFVTPHAPEAARDWTFGDWQPRWGGIAQAACAEAMGYFGRKTPAELAWRMPMILSRAGARMAAARGVPADLRSATGADKVEVDHVETPHEGFFLTRDYALRHPQFGGGQSDLLRREVFVVSDAAIVLPYDPRTDRVLLVEQFRMGPFGRGDPRPWALEPVAGRVDAGETPEDTARRECAEEAGLDLHRLERISSHYCSPGCSTEYFHLFLGLCDLPEEKRGMGGLDSEAEDIRTHVIPFTRATDLLRSGEADNGPLIMCLMWLSMERDRLRGIA